MKVGGECDQLGVNAAAFQKENLKVRAEPGIFYSWRSCVGFEPAPPQLQQHRGLGFHHVLVLNECLKVLLLGRWCLKPEPELLSQPHFGE